MNNWLEDQRRLNNFEDRVGVRFWQKMAARFGFNVWTNRFGEADQNNPLYRDWALMLGKYDVHAVGKAIEQIGDLDLPPSMGKFEQMIKNHLPKIEPEADPDVQPIDPDVAKKLMQQHKSRQLLGANYIEKMEAMIRLRWPQTDFENSAFTAWKKEQKNLEGANL